MYINDINIIYYVLIGILGLAVGQFVDWCNLRLPEYKKVFSKEFFTSYMKNFKPNYILMFVTAAIYIAILYFVGWQTNIVNKIDLIKYLVLTPMLLSALVIDYRLQIIPNRLNLTIFEIGESQARGYYQGYVESYTRLTDTPVYEYVFVREERELYYLNFNIGYVFNTRTPNQYAKKKTVTGIRTDNGSYVTLTNKVTKSEKRNDGSTTLSGTLSCQISSTNRNTKIRTRFGTAMPDTGTFAPQSITGRKNEIYLWSIH